MTRLKWLLLVIISFLILPVLVPGQVSKIAVVDFERALVASAEGKKSSEKFTTTLQSKQAEAEKRQKDLEDAQKKLQTQERTLSESAKANLQKDIDRRTTDLQRFNEDAQKELQSLRDELLRPVAERASAILNGVAKEQGYTLIVDVSNPQTNVVWFNPKNDITEELTRRLDAEPPKTTDAAKPPVTTTTRPSVLAPPRPVAPRQSIPVPTTPRKP